MITLIVGPRRTGKKTIAKALSIMCTKSNIPCRVVDLDDEPLPFNVKELINGDMIVLSSDDEFEVRDMMKKRRMEPDRVLEVSISRKLDSERRLSTSL